MKNLIIAIALLVGAVSAKLFIPGGGYTPVTCSKIKPCEVGYICLLGQCEPVVVLVDSPDSADRPIAPGGVSCAAIKCMTGSECILGNCVPKPKSCENTKCASNEECVMVDVDCVKGPCYPVPECRPKVFPGSTCDGMQCPNQCAMVYPANCDGKDCTPSAQCVDSNSCHWTRCSPGYQCVLQESECSKKPHGVCLPTNTEVQSCLNVKCHTAGGCAMVNPLSCARDKNCQQVAICVEENPCHWIKCSLGFQCVLQEVICKKEPCHPVASCEPFNVFVASL